MRKDKPWTVSPWADSAYQEMLVNYGHFHGNYAAYISNDDWPTLLLNQNVIKESGTGTSTDPFVID